MKINKLLIVGLLAAIGGGLLQADPLIFNLSGSLSYTANNALSGSLTITSVQGDSGTGTCTSCTLTFTTGGLSSPIDTSVTNQWTYNFSANPSLNAFQATTTGTLYEPVSSTPVSFPGNTSGTNCTNAGTCMANGSIGDGGFMQVNEVSSRFSYGYASIPVTGQLLSNLQSVLTAFGLPSYDLQSGGLSLFFTETGKPSANGTFSGASIQAGTLTLNAIPEPASVLLIGLGLISIAFFGRKRLLSHRL